MRAYFAFCQYRDQSPPRSIAATGRAIGRSEKLAYSWSARWDWRERAAAWDAAQDRVACQAQLDGVEKLSNLRLQLATRMFQKALDNIDAAALQLARSPNVFAAWARAAAELARDAFGADSGDRKASGPGDQDAGVQHEMRELLAHDAALAVPAQQFAIALALARSRAQVGQLAAAPGNRSLMDDGV